MLQNAAPLDTINFEKMTGATRGAAAALEVYF